MQLARQAPYLPRQQQQQHQFFIIELELLLLIGISLSFSCRAGRPASACASDNVEPSPARRSPVALFPAARRETDGRTEASTLHNGCDAIDVT